GIDDISGFRSIRILGMKSDMVCSGAMATFTIHTQQHLLWIKCFYLLNRPTLLEESAVALQASRSYRAIEYNLINRKSGAVGPYRIWCIVRSRQLIQRILMPVEVALPVSSRSDGNVEWPSLNSAVCHNAPLKQSPSRLIHHNAQSVVEPDNIPARIEAALHTQVTPLLGSEEVGCLPVPR